MRRADSRRPVLLSSIVVSVALLMISAAVVQSESAAVWRAMAARTAELRDQCRLLPATRDPLWGDASDGVAFEHYEVAAAIMWPLNDVLRQLRTDSRNLPEAGFLALAAQNRDKWQPALAALRAGTHARQLRRDSEHSGDSRILSLLPYREVVNACIYEARCLQAEGDDVGSVQCLLDALTLGVDCVHDGVAINQMVGVAMIAIAAIDCTDDMLHAMSPAALEQFAAGLRVADERLPEQVGMQQEMLFLLDSLHDRPGQVDECSWVTWRYGFSQRWMFADGVLMALESNKLAADLAAASWSDRQRLLGADLVFGAASNRTYECIYPNIVAMEHSMRQSIAALRMLRMAVDLHRGVDAPPLTDPLGDVLIETVAESDSVMLRTVMAEKNHNMQRLVCK